MKLGWAAAVWVSLAAGTTAAAVEQAATANQPAQVAQQQAIPDSPRPQVLPNAGAITPGKGTSASGNSLPDDNAGAPAPSSTLGGGTQKNEIPAADEQPAPDIKPELGPGGRVQRLNVNVNFVQIPFTVKDKNGQLVPALDWREVRVFENGVRQHIQFWTSDPFPLSIAFVIDQTLPFNVMNRVNAALGAVQGAFTPYDEMAIYTYNNGPTLRTDYTGAQSNRVTAVIERAKSTGRDVYLGSPMGPLSQTTNINGHQFDPNTAPVRNSASTFQAPPKETHTLNDAIFMAAQSLAKRPEGRRRIIYVVSDGKEEGSKVKFKDVVHFLQTNRISVYATVVGDSATPYVGWLNHYHLPYEMKNNLLPQYAASTGGEAISEYRQRDIEQSFAKVGEDVRLQYTIGYYSHEPITDGKFRTTEVQVLRPGLDVIAPHGYYPTPQNVLRTGGGAQQPARTPVTGTTPQ